MIAAMVDMIMILSINAAAVSETRANTTAPPKAFAVSADAKLAEVGVSAPRPEVATVAS